MPYNASRQRPWQTGWRLLGGECWVACRGESELVGTVLFRSPAKTRGTDFYDRPGTASLHQLAVDPSMQGSGLGSRLLLHGESRAAAAGASALALDTAEGAHGLIAFYERRGYRIVGRHNFASTPYWSVILAKEL